MFHEIWQRIDRWEDTNLPDVPPRASGAGREALSHAAAVFGTLPAEYIASAVVRDGSQSPVFQGWLLYDLTSAVLQWREKQDSGQMDVLESAEARPGSPIFGTPYLHRRMFPIAGDRFGDHLNLDVTPPLGALAGEVLHWKHDDPGRRVVGRSFGTWLCGLADQLEGGRLVYDPEWHDVRGPVRFAPERFTGVLATAAAQLVGHVRDCPNGALFDVPGFGILRILVYPEQRVMQCRPDPSLWEGPPRKARPWDGTRVAWTHDLPIAELAEAFAAVVTLARDGGGPVRIPDLGDVGVHHTPEVRYHGTDRVLGASRMTTFVLLPAVLPPPDAGEAVVFR